MTYIYAHPHPENSFKFFYLTAEGHKGTEINTRWHSCADLMEPCAEMYMVGDIKSLCLWRGVVPGSRPESQTQSSLLVFKHQHPCLGNITLPLEQKASVFGMEKEDV